MARKVFGFIVGFVAAALLTFAIAAQLRITPNGPGWFFIFIAVGAFSARLASRPRVEVATLLERTAPIQRRWWNLSYLLRLSIVGGVFWIVGAMVLSGNWEGNLTLVLVPPAMMVALAFAHRHLIAPEAREPRSE